MTNPRQAAAAATGSAKASRDADNRPVDRRARLLIVGPLPPPLGGVQMVIDMQLHSGLADEFELHVVDTSKRRLRWAVENPTWNTPTYLVRDFFRLLRTLLRVRPEVTLIHATASLSFVRDWIFMATARLAGSKVVCHYHGTLHTRFPSAQTRSGRFFGCLLMSAAHRVIVLSPGYQKAMSKAWKRDDIAWAPNMVDLALFNSAPAVSAQSWLEGGDQTILFIGRLSAPKGIYDLFDAIALVIARHPRARFLLAGVAESEELEPVIRSEVSRRGIASHIRFLGSLEGRKKVAAFNSAQIIAVPSWTEGFPLVIPEAMAAGLAIVATAVGAIPDFLQDGEDGFLIAPKNPPALADAICRLLDDEALRRRISRRVRDRAAREFALDVGCTKVAGVVRSLLGGPAIESRGDGNRGHHSNAPTRPHPSLGSRNCD